MAISLIDQPRDRRSLLASVLGGSLLAGCHNGFVPQPVPGPEPGANYVALTSPIVVVSDTQEHESTGYPLLENASAIDAYVEVSQRPPQQTLFGRRILEWALQSHPTEPFIHLGDVLDMSCRTEAERIAKIFAAANRPGAILPGNHDGLLFGIFAHDLQVSALDPGAERWNRACRRGATPGDVTHRTDREAFIKPDFITRYITGQARVAPRGAGLVPPPSSGDHSVSWRNPDPDAFVSGIEAHLIDGGDYADSFIAQRLRLPRAPGATRGVIVIALDTNQAGPLVSTWDTIMGRSPGSVGRIRADQVRAVTPWIREAARAGDIVVFAGHHNWQSLELQTRLSIYGLVSDLPHPIAYLSGHTHRGFWAEHRLPGLRPLLELNVSSLSDWPIAYRRISFAYDDRANRLSVRADLMPRGENGVASDAELLGAWVDQTCRQSHIDVSEIMAQDHAIVRQQRNSRGSLFGWLMQSIRPDCDTCDLPLFQQAQLYMDEMLRALLQASSYVPADVRARNRTRLPVWCGGEDFAQCTTRLLSRQENTIQGQLSLFRLKAEMVEIVQTYMDEIETPATKAYMTCRAILAAKIDFDAISDGRNDFRSEANRRTEHFFRNQASIGME
ncbi:hypothetical protein AAFN86_28480 [Roseomonas sp. CAU 1739]|uniref:hypothetical protein n=1 Tax=Roseomonas sp. CAU 1739 TaxID=3140364 RepID=UPI00325A9276